LGSKRQNSLKRSVIGFYWRKASFFAFIFAIGVFALLEVKIFKADVNSVNFASDNPNLTINMQIQKDGSVSVNGSRIKDRINITNEDEELILPVIDNDGIGYSSVLINLNLPEDVAYQSKFDFKGIHGVESSWAYAIDGANVAYEAHGISPMATLSVIVEMPEGTIKPPLIYELYSLLNTVKSNAWVSIAFILPIATALLMFLLVAYQARRQKVEVPKEEITSPPMALPPALVGALFRQKVSAREIAATLIDLALRGDIYILDRERDFAFTKNKYDRRLLSYERILLSKIFRKNLVSDKAEIEQRINNHLYSRKISLVTAGIYIIATRLGYFRINPQKVHLKYQIMGMLCFFLGVAGFVLSFLTFRDPPYIIYFWFGMIISGLIITIVAKKIPNRTPLGQEALSNWLAFKKYLSNPEKIPFSYESQDLFQKYLPYAIVLDCEVAWAKRFSEQNFLIPDWFVSDRSGMGLQDFCLSLFPLISYVARSLAAIREPGFE